MALTLSSSLSALFRVSFTSRGYQFGMYLQDDSHFVGSRICLLSVQFQGELPYGH